MRARKIRVRWSTTCKRCGALLAKGAPAWYSQPDAWCLDHGDGAPERTPEGAPEGADPSCPNAEHFEVKGGTLWASYGSPEAYLADAMRPTAQRNRDHDRAHLAHGAIDDYAGNFMGGGTFRDQWETLRGRFPWSGATETMARMRDGLKIEIDHHVGSRRKAAWRVEGGDYSPQREREGFEDCYRGSKRVRAPGVKTIRIVVNTAAHCGEDQAAYLFNGASIAAVVDALEDDGARCEVWTMDHTVGLADYGTPQSTCSRVCIKRTQDMLSLPHMLTWLANLGAHRTALFAWLLTHPMKANDYLGRPQSSFSDAVTAYWRDLDGEEAFVWPQCRSNADAMRAIDAIRERFKV